MSQTGQDNRMGKSISEIKKEFEKAGENSWERLCGFYEQDSRIGVRIRQQIPQKAGGTCSGTRTARNRSTFYEGKYDQYRCICGIDEAGRGPLAGPVVAGAVILPADCEILYLNDSKTVSGKEKKNLYDEIMEKQLRQE